EADGVRELFRIVDPGDLERPDADAVVRNPEADSSLRQLVLGEELLERHGERVRISQLSADDDACLERFASDLQQLGGSVVGDARGGQLGRPDLEADESLRPLPAAALPLCPRLADLALLRRLRLLGLLRLSDAVGLHHLLALLALFAAERDVL